MAEDFVPGRVALSIFAVTALLLAGCVSAPGTYPDPRGPRSADGFLVDPQTGLTLPGQPDAGGGGMN